MRTYKLGDLIELSELRNDNGKLKAEDVRGISVLKEIIPTKADLTNVNLNSYKVLKNGDFTYSLVTSRNGNRLSIAFNDKEDCIVSSINPVFRVKDISILDPYFLMMFFKRTEFDRYARFHSWGSARETFDWEEMCSVEIPLPSIDIQKKYVAVYKAMQRNLAVYQAKADDLKLVCDGYIEKLRHEIPSEKIGNYIRECDERNSMLKENNVQGVESSGSFMETKANTNGLDFSNYKIVKQNQFAYNPSRINVGSLAIKENNTCIVSPMYIVFEVTKQEKLIPLYLMLWLSRSEFRRSTLFYASGSVRDTFNFDEMSKVKIPIPEIEVQKAIIQIYNSYRKRKAIAEKLKVQINSICPVLVKGAMQEGEYAI